MTAPVRPPTPAQAGAVTRLPCMAIQQPYASLVVRGVKDVENRSRVLPEQLRGKWCAIYASKTLAPVAMWIEAHRNEHSRSVVGVDIKAARKQAVRGAIVGLVRWESSTRTSRSPWAEPGAHHWTYSDRVVLAEPVPLESGCQSIYWYLSEEIRHDVARRVASHGTAFVAEIGASIVA